MKIWIDDIRPAPDDYLWIRTVLGAKTVIGMFLKNYLGKELLIDLDHDAGDFSKDGGDYIEILNWLECEGIVDDRFTFHIHSMNPVGVENMRRIIKRNEWKEV